MPFYASEFKKNWLHSTYPWCSPCAEHWSLALGNSGYFFSISVLVVLGILFQWIDWVSPAPVLSFLIQWSENLQAVTSFFGLQPDWIIWNHDSLFFFRNAKRGLKIPYKDQLWGMLSCKKDFIQSCQIINVLEKPSA